MALMAEHRSESGASTPGWLLLVGGVLGAIVVAAVRANAESDHDFDRQVGLAGQAIYGRPYSNGGFADGGYIFAWVVCGILVVCGCMLIAAASSRSQTPRAAPVRTQSTPSIDEAEQVRKLAQLRDDGLLTVEEFEVKKRKILGL